MVTTGRPDHASACSLSHFALRSDDTDAHCSAPGDGRTADGDSPDRLSIKPGFSLQRRLLNDFISRKPLRRVSLL